MRDTTIIAKYTGHTINLDEITDVNAVIISAAYDLENTERSLAAVAVGVQAAVDKVRANLDAGPGDQVYQLNGLGELQGRATDFDRLIGMRETQIEALRRLVALVVRRTKPEGR